MKIFNRMPVVLTAAAVLLGTGAALQVASAETESLPEVMVQAGPVTQTVVGRRAISGAPVVRTAVEYRVSYRDLDLAKHADVLTLQQRIEGAARSACGQLDELMPIDSNHQQTRECIESAVRDAAPQLEQAAGGLEG
ncbi:MAG TPA: UrcA family protein [Steroidobacteraceae bacterium]|nr:UrcA family protein [Steroidobacteraceae bacterium]